MPNEFPPETADGWYTLHSFYTVNWPALRKQSNRSTIVQQAAAYLHELERPSQQGQSAAFHILGHKGQLMLLHFGDTFDRCAQHELQFQQFELSEFLTPSHSYVSVVELGMYHLTRKIVENLVSKGIEPYSEEWMKQYEAAIGDHREALNDRRYTEIPSSRYFCFYPMNKRRGEGYNWYQESIQRRAELMMEHGMTGRRFAGKVQQIITGSIGFDDWEWGVDLFADDPLSMKRLVYEMRFDEATARYGDFGEFFFGLRLMANDWESYFTAGRIPPVTTAP